MNSSNETFYLLLVLVILIAAISLFIFISLKIRKGGGSMTTISLGAVDECLTKEKSKSAETIVNLNAGKIVDSQTSGSKELEKITES
jgi:hypothetical protein